MWRYSLYATSHMKIQNFYLVRSKFLGLYLLIFSFFICVFVDNQDTWPYNTRKVKFSIFLMQRWKGWASGSGAKEMLNNLPCFWVHSDSSSYFGGHGKGKPFRNIHHGFSEGRFILDKFGQAISLEHYSSQQISSVMAYFQIISVSE